MKIVWVSFFIAMMILNSTAEAEGVAIRNELSRLEGFDFKVSGILMVDAFMGQDYRLSVNELGDFPAVIDGGRDLRRWVHDNCRSTSGCDVTVLGRLEFELPVLLFSIEGVIGIGERQGFGNSQHDFSACWNVGALSSEELQASVTIAFEIMDGLPDPNSIRYLRGSRPQNEIPGLYESARRAVIRCGARGTSIPDGTVELTFDPSGIVSR
jgi:hypothetical protein